MSWSKQNFPPPDIWSVHQASVSNPRFYYANSRIWFQMPMCFPDVLPPNFKNSKCSNKFYILQKKKRKENHKIPLEYYIVFIKLKKNLYISRRGSSNPCNPCFSRPKRTVKIAAGCCVQHLLSEALYLSVYWSCFCVRVTLRQEGHIHSFWYNFKQQSFW